MNNIRKLKKSEQESAIKLLRDSFIKYRAGGDCYEEISFARSYMMDPVAMDQLEFFGFYEGNSLCGVIAMDHQRQHIDMFTVLEHCQRKGIARALWSYVLEHSTSQSFTVESTCHDTEMYLKLGFSKSGPEFQKNGVLCIPMRYDR